MEMKFKIIFLAFAVFGLSSCNMSISENSSTNDSQNSELPSVNNSSSTELPPSNEYRIKPQIPELTTISALESKYSKNNKIEIDLWTGFGDAMSSALETVIEDFEREYPYIDVNHEQKSGYDNLHSNIVNSTYTDSYPNVTLGYPDHFADYILSNIQYALDDFINSKEFGIDLDEYNPQYMRENQSLIYKDDAKSQSFTMGIPFNKSVEVMTYNKTFFDAFGLETPTTWDETITLGKEIISIVKGTSSKLTRDEDKVNHFGTTWEYAYRDASGADKTAVFDFSLVEESDFYPLSYDSQANFFITIVKQFGGKYTEMGDNIKKGYMVFKNDAKVIEALNYVKNMNTQHVLGIPSTWDEPAYCSRPFKEMKTVMSISSSAGVANNIPSGNKFEVGIAPIPYKSADKKFVISQGANFAIFKSDADHALASWLLVRFLSGAVDYPARDADGNYVSIEYNEHNIPIITPVETREESTFLNANTEFAIATGYLPVTKKGEQSDRYQTYIASESQGSAAEMVKIGVKKMVSDIYIKQDWNAFVDAAFVGSSSIRSEVEKIIPFMTIGVYGKIYTAEEAINFVYNRLPKFVE